MSSKLTGKPPSLTSDDFIKGAEKTPDAVAEKTLKSFPWESSEVRDDVIKSINLRLPEAYRLKLNYIAENTPDSAQSFIRKVLLPAIDEEIEALTGAV